MNATWALDRHVSQGLQRLLFRRHGFVVGWYRIRWLWLSGAMDSRDVPTRHLEPRHPGDRVPGSREGIDPEAPVYRTDWREMGN